MLKIVPIKDLIKYKGSLNKKFLKMNNLDFLKKKLLVFFKKRVLYVHLEISKQFFPFY